MGSAYCTDLSRLPPPRHVVQLLSRFIHSLCHCIENKIADNGPRYGVAMIVLRHELLHDTLALLFVAKHNEKISLVREVKLESSGVSYE